MVINSNFDDRTKQRMIAEIQSKYRKANKEANKRKKVSPTAQTLKQKTAKKFGEDPNDVRQERGADRARSKKRAEQKAKTA